MKLVSVFGLSVLGGLGVLDAVQGRVGDFDNEVSLNWINFRFPDKVIFVWKILTFVILDRR
jgi:hypothetical protein